MTPCPVKLPYPGRAETVHFKQHLVRPPDGPREVEFLSSSDRPDERAGHDLYYSQVYTTVVAVNRKSGNWRQYVGIPFEAVPLPESSDGG